jgi:transcriptional regulator with XRE-family HTH domain
MHTNNTAITPDCTALLERVHQAKRLNKLSVETIANAAGMHRPTVQNQLYGRYNLDIRVVLAVARLCPNVSCDWLLRAEGEIIKKDTATQNDVLARIERLERLLQPDNKRIAD